MKLHSKIAKTRSEELHHITDPLGVNTSNPAKEEKRRPYLIQTFHNNKHNMFSSLKEIKKYNER